MSTETTPKLGRPGRDLDQLAIDLINWAKRPGSHHLCQFCNEMMVPPPKIYDYARANDAFRESLELAKSFINMRREEMYNNKDDQQLQTLSYANNQKVYDYFVKYEVRDEMAYKATLDKEQDRDTVKEAVDALSKMQSQLSELRERMISDSKDKTTNKSE